MGRVWKILTCAIELLSRNPLIEGTQVKKAVIKRKENYI